MAPLLLSPAVVVLVGATIAVGLEYRDEGGWALTPWRAAGIPVAAASAQLLTWSLTDPLIVLEPFEWPFTILASIYGFGIVGGAALRRRRWGYLAAAGTATAFGALLAASWGFGSDVHRPYLYFALVAVGVGLVPRYLTAGPGDRS